MMLKEAAEAERLARRILSIDDRSQDAWATLAWALICIAMATRRKRWKRPNGPRVSARKPPTPRL